MDEDHNQVGDERKRGVNIIDKFLLHICKGLSWTVNIFSNVVSLLFSSVQFSSVRQD